MRRMFDESGTVFRLVAVLTVKNACAHARERNVVCTMSGSRGRISLSVIVLMHSTPIAAAVRVTVAQFMPLAKGATGIKKGGFDAAKVTMAKWKRG